MKKIIARDPHARSWYRGWYLRFSNQTQQTFNNWFSFLYPSLFGLLGTAIIWIVHPLFNPNLVQYGPTVLAGLCWLISFGIAVGILLPLLCLVGGKNPIITRRLFKQMKDMTWWLIPNFVYDLGEPLVVSLLALMTAGPEFNAYQPWLLTFWGIMLIASLFRAVIMFYGATQVPNNPKSTRKIST